MREREWELQADPTCMDFIMPAHNVSQYCVWILSWGSSRLLDQGISELLDSLQCYVPEIYNWILGWGTWGSVNDFNNFVIQKLAKHSGHVVMHEEEAIASCTSIMSDNDSEDFTSITNCSKRYRWLTSGVEVCATLQWYSSSDYHKSHAGWRCRQHNVP